MQVQADWIKFSAVIIYMMGLLLKLAGCARDDLPNFDDTLPKNITIQPGERAILNCKVHNRGTRVVSWRRKEDNHPLTIGKFRFSADERFRVDNKKREEEWNLVIERVAPEDKGFYLCYVNTHKTTLEWEVRLNVKTVQVTGNEYVARGEVLHLKCNATGPPGDVEWFKDGTRIESHLDRGIFITRNTERNSLISVLAIKKSIMEDSGDYICRSSNDDYARLRVQVLNIDKENVKRGTSVELRSAGSSLQHRRSEHRLCRILLTLACSLVTFTQLTTYWS